MTSNDAALDAKLAALRAELRRLAQIGVQANGEAQSRKPGVAATHAPSGNARAAKPEGPSQLATEGGGVAVAFSGGVDSSFLLAVARDELGERAWAITQRIRSAPARDLAQAQAFCRNRGIRQVVLQTDELAIPGFADNSPDRCYLCKSALFSQMKQVAQERGAVLCDGSNVDDEGDYRPGMRALAELEVASPLRTAGLAKADIRALSQRMGLPTWDKSSAACLASRIAYGEAITAEKLAMVDAAEAFLADAGFAQCRVRMHGSLARIEVAPAQIEWFSDASLRDCVNKRFSELGFSYITLDMRGYRTGSLNEGLKP